jgi:hypothetical protein
MNKITGGKRINYVQKGSYANRACAAGFSYNYCSFRPAFIFGKASLISSVWDLAKRDSITLRQKKKTHKTRIGPFKAAAAPKSSRKRQVEYGPQSPQGTLSEEEMTIAVANLVAGLQVDDNERQQLEKRTMGQSFSEEWKYQRHNRLTASKCGNVYRLKGWTDSKYLLKSILYPRDLSHNKNVRNGINLEPIAKETYATLHEL